MKQAIRLSLLLLALVAAACTSDFKPDKDNKDLLGDMQGRWTFSHVETDGADGRDKLYADDDPGYATDYDRYLAYCAEKGLPVWEEALMVQGHQLNGHGFDLQGNVLTFDDWQTFPPELPIAVKVKNNQLRITCRMGRGLGLADDADLELRVFYVR